MKSTKPENRNAAAMNLFYRMRYSAHRFGIKCGFIAKLENKNKCILGNIDLIATIVCNYY